MSSCLRYEVAPATPATVNVKSPKFWYAPYVDGVPDPPSRAIEPPVAALVELPVAPAVFAVCPGAASRSAHPNAIHASVTTMARLRPRTDFGVCTSTYDLAPLKRLTPRRCFSSNPSWN